MTPAEQKTEQSPTTRVLSIIAYSIVIIAGMRAAQSIIEPFLLSAFIAVICASPFLFLKRKGLPAGIAMIIVLVGIMIILFVFAALIGTSLDDFSNTLPTYQVRMEDQIANISTWLQNKGINVNHQKLLGYINPGTAMEAFAGALSSFSEVLTNISLIVLTVIFMLLEMSGFSDKLRTTLGYTESSFASLNEITYGIKHYMMIKTLTSLGTGILIAIWLAIIGVDFPILWGMVAFLLNYIPNIGSVIAAVPAVLLALIQLGIFSSLHTIIAYVMVNVLMGNVIEPRVMGKGVGLSPLVVFSSLVFWGWVLGPVGMVLSVPLTMIVKIALEHNADTRKIAVLLG